jgi:hypothetical protein
MVNKLEKISIVEKETSDLLKYNLKCMKELHKLKIKSGLVIKSPKIKLPKKIFSFTSHTKKKADVKRSLPSLQESNTDLKKSRFGSR